MYTEAEYRLLDKYKQLKKLQQRHKQPTPNPALQLQKPPALLIPKGGETKSRLNGVGRSPLDTHKIGKEGTKTLDATERAKALLRGRGRGNGPGTAVGSFKRPSVKRMAPSAPTPFSEEEYPANTMQYNKSQFSIAEKHRVKMPKLDSSIMNGQTTLYLNNLPPGCSEVSLTLAFEQHGFEPDRFQILQGGPNTVIFSSSSEANRLLQYLNSGNKQIQVKGQKIQVGQNPQELLQAGELNTGSQGQGQGQGQNQGLGQGKVTQQQNLAQKTATFKRPLRKQLIPQNKEITRQKSQGEIQQGRENYISEGQNSVKIDDGRGVVTYEDI